MHNLERRPKKQNRKKIKNPPAKLFYLPPAFAVAATGEVM
jgi:hypothetical protein